MKRTKISVLTFFTIIAMAIVLPSFVRAWSDEFPIFTLESYDGLPSIAQMSDEKIWVAWQSNILGSVDILYEIYDGTSWTEPDLLTTDTNNEISPLLLQAKNGTLWLFWSSDKTGNYDIFYKTSPDGGASWSSETHVTNDTRNDNYPAVTQAVDDAIWVIWQRRLSIDNYDLFYKVYNGSSWSTETPLTTDPSVDQVPSATTGADGKIWVAWSSYRTGDFEIFYKFYNGSSWLDEEKRLTFSSNVDVNPSIVQDRNGVTWIAWSSSKPTTTATFDLYYKTSLDNGANWSESIPLTTDLGDDRWPSLAQTSDKKIWVTWASNRYGSYDIFYKTSNDVVIHDVAITDVTPSPTKVSQGENISISVVAQNQGEADETFTVECYANSTLIGTDVATLTPVGSIVLIFEWNTSSVDLGTYIIKATASAVVDETIINLDDNIFIDGGVEVATHDVAVTNVFPSRTSIAQGYTMEIYVTAKNEGGFDESFNVTAYYNSTAIGTQKVTNLGPKLSTELTFLWDTTSVPVGNYVLSATAESVPGEADTTDNSLTDGTFKVKIPGDVNGDGGVNVEDLALVARALGTDPRWPTGTDWDMWNPDCDINYDSRVDIVDFTITGKNYGTGMG